MATITESIKVSARKVGTHHGLPTYRGLLRVFAPWGAYTRSCGVERLTRDDALRDACQRKADWIVVNQLPD